MKKSILKPIIGGIFLGAFVFATGPLLPIVLLLKFIFTPFGMARSRFGGPGFGGPRFAGAGYGGPSLYADKIRSMSDEDYTNFKAKFEGRFNGGCNANNNINTNKENN